MKLPAMIGENDTFLSIFTILFKVRALLRAFFIGFLPKVCVHNLCSFNEVIINKKKRQKSLAFVRAKCYNGLTLRLPFGEGGGMTALSFSTDGILILLFFKRRFLS